jgi:hypothetical protein
MLQMCPFFPLYLYSEAGYEASGSDNSDGAQSQPQPQIIQARQIQIQQISPQQRVIQVRH